MSKILRNIIITGLGLMLLVLGPVALAEEGNGSSSSSGDSSSTTPPSTDEPEKPNDPKLMDRLGKLKTEFKVKLTNTEQLHLKDRCKSAQTIVKSVNDRVNGNVVNRTKAYDELVSRLTDLITKLKTKNIDTAELQSELTVLQAKIAVFKTDMDAYKTSLKDLRSLDCQTDPAAFKAALLNSRTLHDKLVQDAKGIKTYVTDTIKPSLKKIHDQLEAEEQSSNKTQGGGSN